MSMPEKLYPRGRRAWNAVEYLNVRILFANGYNREEVGAFTGRSPQSLTATLSELGITIDTLLAARGLSKVEIMSRVPLPAFQPRHAYTALPDLGLHLFLTAQQAAEAETVKQNLTAASTPADAQFEEVVVGDEEQQGITAAMLGTSLTHETTAMAQRANARYEDDARAADEPNATTEGGPAATGSGEEAERLVPRGPFQNASAQVGAVQAEEKA